MVPPFFYVRPFYTLIAMKRQTLLSLFLAAHLIAVFTSAIARAPGTRARQPVSRAPVGTLASAVGPWLDVVERFEERALDAIWYATAAYRPVSERYLGLLGLGQVWGMFSNVPEAAEYVKLAYVVAPADRSRPYVMQELIFPAWRTDEFRGVGGFRASFRNKALETSMSDFWQSELAHRSPNAALDPVATYYSQQFARTLSANAHLLRTEIWYGTAGNRAPGEAPDERSRLAREATLDEYAKGPERCLTCPTPRPTLGAVQQESAIQWSLLVVRQP